MPPRAVRRLLAPLYVALGLALGALCVAAMPPGVVLAAVDRRRRVLRLAALGARYVGLEVAALAGFFALWVARPVRGALWYDDANLRLVRWVLRCLFGSVRRHLGFSLVVQEQPTPTPLSGTEPVLVLARHGGLGDSFTLAWLLLERYGRRPRVVVKEALQWDPLIDVALTRLGACFLAPGSADRAGKMAALAATLRDGDALLVFPEGANWTPARRVRAIRRLRAERKPRAARAALLMEHVLAPRPAGVLSCIDARPGMPVVVMAHAGLDTLTSVGDVWRALPFDVPMVLRWWPVPAAPAGEEERVGWLTTQWAVVDEWIDAHRPGPRGP